MKFSRRKFIKTSIFSALGIGLIDAFWFERYVIDYSIHDLREDNQTGVKILQISDLHLSGIKSFHKSIARHIHQSKPDLIVITGDSLDSAENIEYVSDFLKLIDKNIQKIAITGNWEYLGFIDLKRLREIYFENNCELLINENLNIGVGNRSINIIGIDDYVGGNADFNKSVQNLKSADRNIILTHCPAHRDVIAKENTDLKIDLIISGHTHGGQVNLFGFVPYKPQGSGNYLKGWYKENGPPMYISRGVGTSIFPIRFGSRAEVAEFIV